VPGAHPAIVACAADAGSPKGPSQIATSSSAPSLAFPSLGVVQCRCAEHGARVG
jgi:hypothetical protein